MTDFHEGQVPIDDGLVRHLVDGQFPEYAALPLRHLDSGGTVNAIYRLGDGLSVRLPLVEWAVPSLLREFEWTPWLAPHLPLPVPEPIHLGEPASDYPFPWAIHRWLPGAMLQPDEVDRHEAAERLAAFVLALRTIDTSGAPPNTHRAAPVVTQDAATRQAIESCSDRFDAAAGVGIWEEAMRAPVWQGDPVWVHGDLWHSNMLMAGGRVSAVIDFGSVGIGDPAIDTLPAWSVLDRATRPLFREMLGVDDATWTRGRGWAMSMAALAIPYYEGTNTIIVRNAYRMIGELLGE